MSTTMSAREFNQDVARAKRAAASGPVFITDRGEPAFVLLSIEDYRDRDVSGQELVDLLFLPEGVEIGIDEATIDEAFTGTHLDQAPREIAW